MDSPPLPSFSFSGAGWLFLYHFGVAKALRESGVATAHNHYIGTSGGALVSVCLLLDLDLEALRDCVVRKAMEVREKPFPRAFQVRNIIVDSCEEFIGEELFLEKKSLLETNLTVCITRLPSCTAMRMSKFESYAAFKECLLASCLATPLCGLPFKMRGQWVADGGISDQQPVIDSNTITVAPLYFSNSDIRPSRTVPVWWSVYPPADSKCRELFALGYEDSWHYLEKSAYKIFPNVSLHTSQPITNSGRQSDSKPFKRLRESQQNFGSANQNGTKSCKQTRDTRASLLWLGLVREVVAGRETILEGATHGIVLMGILCLRLVAYVMIYFEFTFRTVMAFLGTFVHVGSCGGSHSHAQQSYIEKKNDMKLLVKGTVSRLVTGQRWGSWLSARSLTARLMYFAL